MLTIDLQTARRFILGKQGLWPGRRWRGIKGTEKAMLAMEYLQLDPLQILARSQDIALHSRVLEYKRELWQDLTYRQRKFFDWGAWLAVRPMGELPYWRAVMHRERDGDYGDPRLRHLAREHADAIREMRAILQERDVVSNRDFEMATRTRTQSYRGRKDSALALYYLWHTGEAMTHHRERFERLYALTEKVAPAHQRKFGYYALPVLWGDRLVARFDSKLDRTTNTFVILGFWLEDKLLAKQDAFGEALALGFSRFAAFLGASKMDAKAIREPLLRRRVNKLELESL